jgi:hypothetical protein
MISVIKVASEAQSRLTIPPSRDTLTLELVKAAVPNCCHICSGTLNMSAGLGSVLPPWAIVVPVSSRGMLSIVLVYILRRELL